MGKFEAAKAGNLLQKIISMAENVIFVAKNLEDLLKEVPIENQENEESHAS